MACGEGCRCLSVRCAASMLHCNPLVLHRLCFGLRMVRLCTTTKAAILLRCMIQGDHLQNHQLCDLFCPAGHGVSRISNLQDHASLGERFDAPIPRSLGIGLHLRNSYAFRGGDFVFWEPTSPQPHKMRYMSAVRREFFIISYVGAQSKLPTRSCSG